MRQSVRFWHYTMLLRQYGICNGPDMYVSLLASNTGQIELMMRQGLAPKVPFGQR